MGTAAISLGQIKVAANGSIPSELSNLSLDKTCGTSVRNLFPMDANRLYLNTGGLGPPSSPVIDAVQQQTLKQAIEGEIDFETLLSRSF